MKPYVTQHFGENPKWYKKFNLFAHDGTDLRSPVGSLLFAPIDGQVEVRDSKVYGIHVIITNHRLRVLLAHLSEAVVHTSQIIKMGEYIGKTGNTGNSTAPHLHISVYRMNGPQVLHKDNGYFGAFDAEPYMICWRGSLEKKEVKPT